MRVSDTSETLDCDLCTVYSVGFSHAAALSQFPDVSTDSASHPHLGGNVSVTATTSFLAGPPFAGQACVLHLEHLPPRAWPAPRMEALARRPGLGAQLAAAVTRPGSLGDRVRAALAQSARGARATEPPSSQVRIDSLFLREATAWDELELTGTSDRSARRHRPAQQSDALYLRSRRECEAARLGPLGNRDMDRDGPDM